MYRLIALDLDDTLLQPSGHISSRTVTAVRALHERGVTIALASGRMLPTMLPIAEQLGFAPALVSYNGAQVNLTADTPPLYHCPVPAALAEQVIEYSRRRNVHLNLYHNDRLFCSHTDNWQTRVYHEQTGAILEYEPGFERFRGASPTKLLIIDGEEQVAQMLAECQERFQGQLTLTRSRPIYLEFLHPSVNKGEGFKALCRELDVPLEQTAAFGDAYNDLEMLQAAGAAFAMENALPEVKAIADRVIPSNAEDGVAQTLEEIIMRADVQGTGCGRRQLRLP
jgi:Cof subfamily protein (haloacid dehalogenase superfamily)